MSDFSKEKEVSRRFAEIVRRNEFCQRVAEQLEREFHLTPGSEGAPKALLPASSLS